MKNVHLRLLVLLILGTLLAAPSYAAPSKLVGSWNSTSVVSGGGESQTLWTFGRGGTVVVSASIDGFSAAHGAWEKVAPRTFDVINTAFGYAPDGSLAIKIVNRATIEVAHGGGEFTAAFTSEIQALDGTVIFSTSGTAVGDRIEVGD